MADLITDATTGLYNLFNDDVVYSFSNVYSRHDVAAMTLPAITIGAVSCIEEEEDFARDGSSGNKTLHQVVMSVRIHGHELGGVAQQATVAGLVDDAIGKLLTNRDSGIANYRIMTAGAVLIDAEFPETQTGGAEVHVTLHTQVVYTEET